MSLDYLLYSPQKNTNGKLQKNGTSRYGFIWDRTKRKSFSDFFLKPYDASEEFEYHFYRTFRSPVLCAIFWALPGLAITLAICALVGTLMLAVFTDKSVADSLYTLFSVIGSLIVDLIVAPLSIMVMLTRGCATLVSKCMPKKPTTAENAETAETAETQIDADIQPNTVAMSI